MNVDCPGHSGKHFQRVVLECPKSANSYDSRSDAYEADGDKEKAIEFAQKALAMLPKPDRAQQHRQRQPPSANYVT